MTFKIFLSLLIMCGVFGTEDDEEKTLSVMEGDSVTLNINIAEIQGFNLIQWRFGGEGFTIARTDGNEISYADDGIFRDRLQLNQTGSLTIKNMKNTDSGLYRVEISSSKQMINKRFIVTVSGSGVSPGRNEIEIVVVKMGDDVTLHTDDEIEKKDHFLWMFESQCARIAEIKEGTRETFDGADGRFTDRLMLDETGSLTIRNIDIRHDGVYKLQFKRWRLRRWPFYKRFAVIVNEERTISVMEGDDVTLNTDTELSKDKEIKWQFEDCGTWPSIAEIIGETGEIFTYEGKADGRFRNRLKLDHLTGSLTIKNTGPEHTGCYGLEIKHCGGDIFTILMVSVSVRQSCPFQTDVINEERRISVEEGKNVTLETDSETQKDDQILWMFGAEETLIAQIKGETRETHDVADGRFRGRLKLDEQTGSLTITNFRTEHTGLYKMKINRSDQTSKNKSFDVFARVAMVSEEEEMNGNGVNESVTLVKSLSNGDNLDVVNEQH